MSKTTHKASFSEQAQKYLNYGQVPELLQKLNVKDYPVSDIFVQDPTPGSKRNLYFVDLVQQGGGVLGVALVGYTMALEAAGIRFLSLAGTSAGAINTILLAGLGKPVDEKSGAILEELCQKNFSDFVDPGSRVLLPIKGLMGNTISVKILSALGLFLFNLPGIFRKGLCSGKAFEQWVESVLKKKKIESISQLIKQMNELPPNLKINHTKSKARNAKDGEIKARIAIISADITTQTKVEFPRMAELYVSSNPEIPPSETYEHLGLLPKDMVRASMAIPMFYTPKTFTPPKNDENIADKWKKMAEFYGKIPDKIQMVDGGIMSNFPIDLFHETDRSPKRPTFGIRLGLSRQKPSGIGGVFSHFGAIFNGARNLRDFEFLFKNEDYKHLVQYIDTEDFNWLNFSISEVDKMKLFELGVKAAYDFLEGSPTKPAFNWKQYQALRRRILFFSSSDRIESLWDKEDAIRKLGLDEKTIIQRISDFAGKIPKISELIKSWLATNFKTFQDNLDTVESYLKNKKKSIKILWVDDDPANDFFELSVLRALGIEFFTALDNQDAFAKLEEHPDILAVVTDSYRQGKLDEGLKLCQELYEKYPTLPVLLHSVSQASKYLGKEKEEAVKEDFIDSIKNHYSPLIVGNFIDARELIMAIIEVLANSITQKK